MLYDPSVPLEKRWNVFEPYWQHVRFGSYARAGRLAAKLYYGVDDINRQTYQELSDRIAEESNPGLYQRIFVDTCRAAAVLTQAGGTNCQRPLVAVVRGRLLTQVRNREYVDYLSATFGLVVNTIDDWLHLCKKQVEKWVQEGAVGVKFLAQYNPPPDRAKAEQAFKKLMAGEALVPGKADRFEPFENYVMHHVIDLAGSHDLVVALHSGIWGDFRQTDPKHVLTLAPAHPQTNFDLYHLGMPFVRDAIVIGKNLPNVFLNLCWCHIVSQAQTCSGIDELLDQVPVNKVIAFGGDEVMAPENIIGHLQMARENFAQVFGRRIDRGLMDFDEAMQILRLWFWDNPLQLYRRLKV
jgi:predicted TIM-barrel fold metal-dependent hydrolase